jgi:hypothetical protein
LELMFQVFCPGCNRCTQSSPECWVKHWYFIGMYRSVYHVAEVSILHLHAVKLTVDMFPFQAPQQNFCLSDMMASYSRSHCEYAGGTRSICGNNQWSWPSLPQLTYLPNFTPRPSSFSLGSGITLVKIVMPLICTAILKRFLLLNFFCG